MANFLKVSNFFSAEKKGQVWSFHWNLPYFFLFCFSLSIPLFVSKPWSLAVFFIGFGVALQKSPLFSASGLIFFLKTQRNTVVAWGFFFFFSYAILRNCVSPWEDPHNFYHVASVIFCSILGMMFYLVFANHLIIPSFLPWMIVGGTSILLVLTIILEAFPTFFDWIQHLSHWKDRKLRWLAFRKSILSELGVLALIACAFLREEIKKEPLCSQTKWVKRGFFVWILGATLWVNLWVSSFASLLAFFGGGGTLFLYCYWPLFTSRLLTYGGASAFFILPLIKFFFFAEGIFSFHWFQQIPAGIVNRLYSLQERWLIWDIATGVMKHHFWWGIGKKATEEQLRATFVMEAKLSPMHLHNYIFQLWMELGCVGVSFFVFLWWAIGKAVHQSSLSLCARAGIFAMLGYNFLLGQAAFEFWKTWWWGWMGICALCFQILWKSQNEIVPRGTI